MSYLGSLTNDIRQAETLPSPSLKLCPKQHLGVWSSGCLCLSRFKQLKYCLVGQRNNGGLITQLFCYYLPFRKSNGRDNFCVQGRLTTCWHLAAGRLQMYTHIHKHRHTQTIFAWINFSVISSFLIFRSCLCLSQPASLFYWARSFTQPCESSPKKYLSVESVARDNWKLSIRSHQHV